MKLELTNIWAKRRKVSDERMLICRECPELEQDTTRCKQCGCFMKGKTFFMDSKCPLGKWDKHKETTDGISN